MNGKLCISIESKVEIELEKNFKNVSDVFTTSIPKLDYLVEIVCESIKILNDFNSLISILSLYSARLFAYNDNLDVYNGCSEYIRPQILFSLAKNWVISFGISTRIVQLENTFSEQIKELFLKEISKDSLSDSSSPLLVFLMFSQSTVISSLISNYFRENLSYLDEIKFASRLRFLRLIGNKNYALKQTDQVRSVQSTKTKNNKNVQKLESEINQLNTLEQKTCAVLNMIAFDDKSSGDNKMLKANNYHFIFNLWDDYINVASEDRLIIEIIETKNLPSKFLKCEILFIILTYITELSTFEKVIKLIISNTSHDHKIMCYICSRWESLLEKSELEYVSENKKTQIIQTNWKNMRTLIWEFQVLMPLISESVSYYTKLQSIALSCYLISNFVQKDESIYNNSQEIKWVYKLLQIFAENMVPIITNDSALYTLLLERNVLPRINAFPEKTIFSLQLINLISGIVNVDLGNDVNKTVYYQLASNILCDPFIKSNFTLDSLSETISEFFEILDFEKLFMNKNLTKFIYLFGEIPCEIITFTFSNIPIKSHFELPFLDTFSPRIVKNSTKYYNSLRFTQEFTKIITNIAKLQYKTNIKTILLFLIDLIKRLYNQYMIDLRVKKANINDSKNEQIDFYYSYIILYKYLNHCFEKYKSYIDDHIIMTLKSVVKPELIVSKDLIFVL